LLLFIYLSIQSGNFWMSIFQEYCVNAGYITHSSKAFLTELLPVNPASSARSCHWNLLLADLQAALWEI